MKKFKTIVRKFCDGFEDEPCEILIPDILLRCPMHAKMFRRELIREANAQKSKNVFTKLVSEN